MARKKGSKNYTRQGDKIINQFGVVFTEQEHAKLERLSKKNNNKRSNIINKLKVHTPTTYLMNAKPIIFAPRKTSTSLQKFRSKEAYNKYVNNIISNTSKDFTSKRVETYKENYKNALKFAFGRSSREIRDKIDKLTDDEFQLLILKNPNENISYIYSPFESGQLQHIDNMIENIKGVKV